MMASSNTLEEKINGGNAEEVAEQEPCLTETNAQQRPLGGRQTSVAVRARQYWQQLRRLLAFDIFATCICGVEMYLVVSVCVSVCLCICVCLSVLFML